MEVKDSTAKKAAKKGFSYPSEVAIYKVIRSGSECKWHCCDIQSTSDVYDLVAYIPTQVDLQKWLREKHNIDVEMSSWGELNLYEKDASLVKRYTSKVSNWNVKWSVHDGTGIVMPEHYHFEGKDYEKVFEKGLQAALKLIK